MSTDHIPQVRASPQARAYFARVCAEEDITPLQLIKWVRTRWGSMHDLIERVLTTKPVCFRPSSTNSNL